MAIPWTSFVVWNLCHSGTRSKDWRKKSALKQNTKPTHMMQKVARVKVSLPRLLLMAFPIHRSLGLKMWPPSWQLPGSLPPDEVTLGFISRGLPGARSCHPETWLWILWWQGYYFIIFLCILRTWYSCLHGVGKDTYYDTPDVSRHIRVSCAVSLPSPFSFYIQPL